MNPLPLRASALAEQDVVEAATRIAAYNPAAAIQFLDAVGVTESLLAENPELGEVFPSKRYPQVRRFLLHGFHNYVLYYQIQEDCVFEIRLLHAARDQQKALEG